LHDNTWLNWDNYLYIKSYLLFLTGYIKTPPIKVKTTKNTPFPSIGSTTLKHLLTPSGVLINRINTSPENSITHTHPGHLYLCSHSNQYRPWSGYSHIYSSIGTMTKDISQSAGLDPWRGDTWHIGKVLWPNIYPELRK